MEINELKTICLDAMKVGIDSVVAGEVDEVELFGVRPAQVEAYLESEYSVKTDDREINTNGWEWDFWFDYNVKGKTFGIAGDGFYEQSIEFRRSEEEYED